MDRRRQIAEARAARLRAVEFCALAIRVRRDAEEVRRTAAELRDASALLVPLVRSGGNCVHRDVALKPGRGIGR